MATTKKTLIEEAPEVEVEDAPPAKQAAVPSGNSPRMDREKRSLKQPLKKPNRTVGADGTVNLTHRQPKPQP